MIEAEQVTFGYQKDAISLHDISMKVYPGECVLLCGESGCGKTTVTKLINGLIPHYAEGCYLKGKVKAEGFDIADTELYKLAEHIGSVFQNPKSQFFNLDTDSELAFGLENQGVSKEQMQQRLDFTIKELEIKDLLHRSIFSMSGGEKQMLAFASVYAMNPDIYVLDEPTANLDENAIERLKTQIFHLKQSGKTIVIAEHRLYFLADLIDRALYIKDGRIDREFTGEEFRSLSEEERILMGLRTIRQTELSLPAARTEEAAGLEVRNLTCGYKKEDLVFEGLSFTVRPGEVLAVTGNNGVGKSTLIRCLCGLVKEKRGQILLDGVPLKAKQRQKISFCVMQDVNHQLFFDSVREECVQAAGEYNERVEEVLKRLNIFAQSVAHPMALSGGQKQRLAVATALLSDKKILIFDEPTSGLDYRHMKEVCGVIRTLADEGHIILVVSHDKEFMKGACDRILRLKK